MMHRRLTYAALALAAFFITTGAFAQGQPAEASPPPATTPDNPPLWIYYMLLLVLVGGSIMISIMPSKRGHQD